jgi:Na+/proline symporter
MPAADVNAGLVLPNAAVALLGKGGAACTLLLVFMAVTSASSAELIAVYVSFVQVNSSNLKLIKCGLQIINFHI